jgi:predicted O-methyltransferase YrrM
VQHADLEKGLRRQYDQVDALWALYRDIDPARSLPPLGTWAASPDLMRFVYGEIVRTRPRRVVECGSGSSTVVIAYALERLGERGTLVALEHDPTFLEQTRELLEEHGLTERVDLRHAPLEDVELSTGTFPWYAPTAVPTDVPIDLVFIDGPPGHSHPMARYPALPVLAASLSQDAVVVLDDFRRAPERDVVARWLEEFAGLELQELTHEKGTALLRQQATGAT